MDTYEGKTVLRNNGIAQGGIIDTPDGKWYGVLFKDNGAVGRIPYIIPATWQDGWPVFGDTQDTGISTGNMKFNIESPMNLINVQIKLELTIQ